MSVCKKVAEAAVPIVVTVDGEYLAGKSSVRVLLAKELGFAEFDTSMLYRALAFVAWSKNVSETTTLIELLAGLDIRFEGEKVFLNGKTKDKAPYLRKASWGHRAAKLGAIPEIRAAIHQFQKDAVVLPGLVIEGGDTGWIFDTKHRFWLGASAEKRAGRLVEIWKSWRKPRDFAQALVAVKARDERNEKNGYVKRHPAVWEFDTGGLDAPGIFQAIMPHLSTIPHPEPKAVYA